jgi:Spy/CpxP family protein refolding chaperone
MNKGIPPVLMDQLDKQQAANGLKSMQWDVELMMSLTPEQRRAIDAAVKALDHNPLLD